tara:strand:+ start:14805 stop:15815 length:1011 start_codon:yes stop_codon:yes gene_type:complete
MYFARTTISTLAEKSRSITTGLEGASVLSKNATAISDKTIVKFVTLKESAELRIAKDGSASTALAPLYSFTTATFNTNRSDRYGIQSIGEAISVMSGSNASWNTNTSFFSMPQTGFQLWTVPDTGTYQIITRGAGGGTSNNWGQRGGYGAYQQGDFTLNNGDKLKMVVGQRGQNNTYDGGGGGGSYVVLEVASVITPLIISGGGGGGAPNGDAHRDTRAGTSGRSASGSGGSNGGGGGGSTAGGGGGLTGNGAGSWGGYAFTSNAQGNGSQAQGGFGGGAGGGGTNGAGGGGGYSGGGYSGWSGCGGAGGSYNIGENQSNAYAQFSGNGSITITKL